jgi:hypothetical protein
MSEQVPQGLKPESIAGSLRGAEAPLFHGTATVRDSNKAQLIPPRYS